MNTRLLKPRAIKRGLLLITFLIACLLSAQGAQEAKKRPMTLDDIIAMRAVSDPQLSPDGRTVAFVVTQADMKANFRNSDLWIVSTDGGAPQQLTRGPKRDDQPLWSPDGRNIAFISDRDGKPQIYLISPSAGEAYKLTDHRVGIQSFAWSPDGKSIAFIAADPIPEEREKEKREGFDQIVVDQEHQYAHISRIDIESKKVTHLTEGPLHAVELAWSPDGQQIAFTGRNTPKLADMFTTEIYLISANGGALRQLTQNQRAENNLAWSFDGKKLSYLSTSDKYPSIGPSRVHLLTMPQGGEPKVLQRGFDGYIRNHVWSRDGKYIYLQVDYRVNRHIYRMSADGAELESLTVQPGAISAFSLSANDRIAYLYETPERPADVWFSNLQRPAGAAFGDLLLRSDRLTGMNPEVGSLLLGKTEVVRWKSSKDGREIEGLLVYPISYNVGQRYPLITSVHGGPEGAYVQSFMASHNEFPHVLAAEGYAYFFPNFRGSSNYGAAFAEANVGDLGGGDFQDIMSGIDFLIQKGIADPNRLGIKGWSYGGYMSGWAIGHSDRFKAAAFGAGLSNAISYYSQADIQHQRETLHQGNPWRNPQNMIERSPVMYLQNARTPSLIFHGEKDERVPLPQSLETYMGLRKHNVPAELVIYPREPHGLREPKHQLDKMRRELAWFKRYL